MGKEMLEGYHGRSLSVLLASGAVIGDIIKITDGKRSHEGTLMPKIESGDDQHIIIKLSNGYNVGVKLAQDYIVEKIGVGEKPKLASPVSREIRGGLPSVTVISTGGTIASRVEYRTGSVHPALSADDLLSVVPELSNTATIETEILFSIFSENVTPSHWKEMAQACDRHIKKGTDGIVLCHGTDTMGYSAAALSFALQNLPVPIVLVGAQRSSDRPSSDAASNLIGAIKAATDLNVAEVLIAMHESTSDGAIVLHRGTKVRKCHTSRRDAFKPINSGPIARVVEGKMEVLAGNLVPRDTKREVVTRPVFEERVALLKYYPGLKAELIDWFSQQDYRGIVFEGTGLGHVNANLVPSIKKAINKGMLVCMTSQCIWGRVSMNVYDTGRDLQAAGVTPLGDILPETALVKMMWVLGQTSDKNEAEELLKRNLVGEFSDRTLYMEA